MNNLSDYVGAFGVGLLLLAYLLTIFKVIQIDSRLYLMMNIIGASFACMASVMIHYFPFIILEGAWVLVSKAAFMNRLKKVQF